MSETPAGGHEESEDPQWVEELSDRYANFMVNPLPAGDGVCATCRTPCDPSYSECFNCGRGDQWLDAVIPVSYSVNLGQLHTALRGYKDGWGGDRSDALRDRFTVELASVLSRFLKRHEPCIAHAAGVDRFDVVTTVPSGTADRERDHWRLRWIVEQGCLPTASRYRRLLGPTEVSAQGKAYSIDRYAALEPLTSSTVLLIDDTWTQGHSAQSAGAALKRAGAGSVALVVLGRHVDPDWQVVQGERKTCGDVLTAAPPWSWDTCATHV